MLVNYVLELFRPLSKASGLGRTGLKKSKIPRRTCVRRPAAEAVMTKYFSPGGRVGHTKPLRPKA